ncbi:MAG: aminoacyl-tRNA hydrolase [Tissierellia bacterium]|nr:aminoacyl-tRNA hydrolase [Tissierellia bacterium]
MKLIVGLGNPGTKYEYTRHNIGFLTLDKIAQDWNIKVNKIKFKGLWGQGTFQGEKVYLLKPQTYMNNSGESVREIVDYFKINIQDVIVIVDDIDIDFGEVRIKKKGSAGTHNGLRSIIYHLVDDGFPRIKIGVGKKHEKQDLASFVLSGFSTEEGKVMKACIQRANDIVNEIVKYDVERAMNKYNGRSVELKS